MGRRENVLAAAIIAAHFGPPFMFSGVAVALPRLGVEMHAGATALGLVETLFLAGGLAFLLPVGRLAEAGGKALVYKLGLGLFGLSAIAIGLSRSIAPILVLRFLQGLFSSAFAAAGPALLAELVPPERRGRAFGYMLGTIYAGLTIGPIVGGFLVEAWGWRAVFLFGGAVLLLACGFTHAILPATWTRPRGAVHLPSTLLSAASVLALVFGTAYLRDAWWLLAAGAAGAVVFLVWQTRLARPLLDVRALLANPVLRDGLLVQMLLYVNAFTSVFMLSLFMQLTLGHPAARSGWVIAASSVVMAVLAPVAGALGDKLGPHRVVGFGVAAVLLSSLLGTTLHAGSSLVAVAGLLAVQGLGYGLFSSPNMAMLMASVPPEQGTLASALGAMSRSVGMIAGMLITAVLISMAYGHEPVAAHPLRLVGVLERTFAVVAGLCAIALGVSFIRSRAASAARPGSAG